MLREGEVRQAEGAQGQAGRMLAGTGEEVPRERREAPLRRRRQEVGRPVGKARRVVSLDGGRLVAEKRTPGLARRIAAQGGILLFLIMGLEFVIMIGPFAFFFSLP